MSRSWRWYQGDVVASGYGNIDAHEDPGSLDYVSNYPLFGHLEGNEMRDHGSQTFSLRAPFILGPEADHLQEILLNEECQHATSILEERS